MTPVRTVLVTGATGYVGGRLVPLLLEAGDRVRVAARHPDRLRDRPWYPEIDACKADVFDAESLRRALDGVDVAYYLIHSIGGSGDFERSDRAAAEIFARTAADCGVGRIVYLGGLAPSDEEMSPHLRSRQEVGRIFLDAPTPAVVLQAGVIIGSGSASFEMLRYLTERLPAMVTPRWVRSRVQPIAIRDALYYLAAASRIESVVNRAVDIGGPDVLTYADMMRRYAVVAGLPPRRIITLPLLSPRLSSLWIGLVTPVPSGLARPLVESLRNTVVCDEHDIASYVPDPPEGLLSFEAAVELALARTQAGQVVTRWTGASVDGAPSDPLPTDPGWAGGDIYVDERSAPVDAMPSELWSVVKGIGGAAGWYSWPLAWRVRGVIDRLWGGPGLRRGRRDAADLQVGDALDFWRVESVEADRLLRLRAEMRLPGRAWLEFVIEGSGEGGSGSRLRQRAVFYPRGLLGRLYWWAVLPFHGVVFGGMLRNVARTAEQRHRDRS
jgi:uncharacterized protein YbjT (DUF2867 family)